MTLGKDVKEGAVFDLSGRFGAVKQGQIVHRTKNEHLLNVLQERYLKENLQVKIKGDLRIFHNAPAILKLSYGDAAVVCRETIAETAQNMPTSEESIRKQMNKTGGTSFIFESLDVSVEDGLFIPVKKLNEFRRNALARLEDAILDRAGRRLEEMDDHQAEANTEKKSGESSLRYSSEGSSQNRVLNIAVSSYAQQACA